MQSRALINPLPKKSGVTLRATIQNPRPRKYASDADRQKAFRDRQAMIQIRVAPKAVETFDEIAETLGYSRQEVVYALLMKGLMSLGNWETVGLPIDWQKKMPQFKLPKYEENPIMRKATPAQLAARERFAEMARSGAFKRKAKKNPAKKRSKPDPFVLAEIERANAHWAKTFGFSPDLIEIVGARTKFLEGQGLSYNDAFMQAVAEAKTKTGPFSVLKNNPAKKTVSQKISQLTREGYPQRQAVAIALSEQRAGKVKKNPAREGIGFEGYDPYASRDRLEEYREKSDAELRYIMKDAGEAARAQRGMTSEAKYLDQVNDAATVLYERKMAREKAIARSTKKIGKREASAINRLLSGRGGNPAERERKPRVVLITNPKQRMGLIAFRTAGGALTTKEVPILFSFKMPVAANLYGEKSTMDFFAHKDGREIAVTEKTTGFKLGNIPRVFMAVGRDEKAAAKYFVEDLLKQHGAAKFRAAVKSKPKIA